MKICQFLQLHFGRKTTFFVREKRVNCFVKCSNFGHHLNHFLLVRFDQYLSVIPILAC